jgi:hypothetical protein
MLKFTGKSLLTFINIKDLQNFLKGLQCLHIWENGKNITHTNII